MAFCLRDILLFGLAWNIANILQGCNGQSAPNITQTPEIEVQGQEVILTCSLDSEPFADVLWYANDTLFSRDNRVMNSDLTHVSLISNNAGTPVTYTLVIASADWTRDDTTNYSCKTTIGLDEKEDSVILDVQVPVTIESKSADIIDPGSNAVDLSCESSCGYPTDIAFSWYGIGFTANSSITATPDLVTCEDPSSKLRKLRSNVASLIVENFSEIQCCVEQEGQEVECATIAIKRVAYTIAHKSEDVQNPGGTEILNCTTSCGVRQTTNFTWLGFPNKDQIDEWLDLGTLEGSQSPSPCGDGMESTSSTLTLANPSAYEKLVCCATKAMNEETTCDMILIESTPPVETSSTDSSAGTTDSPVTTTGPPTSTIANTETTEGNTARPVTTDACTSSEKAVIICVSVLVTIVGNIIVTTVIIVCHRSKSCGFCINLMQPKR